MFPGTRNSKIIKRIPIFDLMALCFEQVAYLSIYVRVDLICE